MDEQAADDVAGEQQRCAAQRDDGKRAAEVLAVAQCHQVGHDQSDEWNRPDDDDRYGHRHRDQHEAQRRGSRIAEPQAGCHVLAHAEHGEAMRVQIGQGDDGQDQIDDLVMALNDAREIAQQPALHALQDVVAIGVELGHGAEHAAVHQADDRHQYRIAPANAANDAYVEQAGGQAEHQREQHAARRAGRRRQRQRHQDAELGGIQPTGSAGLDEAIAHDVLQDDAADRQAHAGQHHGRQAWQAAGRQRQPGVARSGKRLRPRHRAGADQQGDAAQHGQQAAQARGHQRSRPGAAG